MTDRPPVPFSKTDPDVAARLERQRVASLYLDLIHRGLSLRREDELLKVEPAHLLTAVDAGAIQGCALDLLKIVDLADIRERRL